MKIILDNAILLYTIFKIMLGMFLIKLINVNKKDEEYA